jgi:hypothetical protein
LYVLKKHATGFTTPTCLSPWLSVGDGVNLGNLFCHVYRAVTAYCHCYAEDDCVALGRRIVLSENPTLPPGYDPWSLQLWSNRNGDESDDTE